MERVFRYKNILPTGATVEKVSENKLLLEKTLPVLGEIMPDLKGLSPREVSLLFKDKDVDIEIIGKGTVDTYSPSIGTGLKGVKKIKLYLKEK